MENLRAKYIIFGHVYLQQDHLPVELVLHLE